jgi:hypothetical protein
VKADGLGIQTQTKGDITTEVKELPQKEKTNIQPEQQNALVDASVKKPNTKKIESINTPTTSKPDLAKNKPVEIKKPIDPPTPKTDIANTKVESTNKETIARPSVTPALIPTKTFEEIIAPASLISGRKSEFKEEVNFKSDSLELALYDNGEIDGDTVSVYLNGQLLMARQGLKATAIKKTIYITPGKDDEFTLVLYAENLGKYPPNTGLLVVHDGEDVYNIRFSSDFQKNAGVVFRRKK